ncbi:MAG: hypothetical protein HOK99_00715 [Betaproteobacteria bacterium]|jgi:hypothetical protein|nr:hypothetical protein [Betaproteobacteria bacterium]
MRWTNFAFLQDKMLRISGILGFLFGHLILLHSSVQLLVRDFLVSVNGMPWWLKLTGSSEGKLILLYYGCFALSLAITLSSFLPHKCVKTNRNFEEFFAKSDNFLIVYPSAEQLIAEEYNWVSQLRFWRMQIIRNLYDQLGPLEEGSDEYRAQCNAIIREFFETKDKSFLGPQLVTGLVAIAVGIFIYLSISMFIRVSIAAKSIISG